MEILPNENDNSRYQLVCINENFQTNQDDSLDNIRLKKSTNINYINSFTIQNKQRSKTSFQSIIYNSKNSTQNNPFNQTASSEPVKKPFARIIVFFHMQTFIKKLLRAIRPSQQLSKEQINIINDKASSFKNLNFAQTKISLIANKNMTIESFHSKITQFQRDILAFFAKISEKLLSIIPLIDPYNSKKVIWDAAMTTFRIYLLFWIPILIAFDNKQLEDFTIINFLIFSLIFFVDIVLQTFTIKFDKGLPVKDRKTLLKQQCNFWTILELLCVLNYFLFAWQFSVNEESFSLLRGNGWVKGLLVFVYFQIRNILQFIEDIQYLLRLNKKLNTIIELIKLIGLILLVQHFFSCVWIIIGTYSYQVGQLTWMEAIYDQSWIYIYLNSLYFTSVTTYTVGFGDICPKNTLERTFLCFYMLLCSLQLSYSVNTIGSILTYTKQVNEEIKQKMTIITEYMKNKQISFALQYKVREYFNFYYLQENQQIKLEKMKLIDILPEQLQLDLKMEAAEVLIKKCKFFSNKFSEQYKEKLLQKSIFQTYQPGIVIQDLDNLYIIEQGQVEILQGPVKIKMLNQYDYFSHNKTINFQNEQLVYRTSTFASILMISRDDLISFLINNQNEYEKLQEVGDPNLKKCYLCKKQHKTENCCLFHFTGDKEKIIKSYLFRCRQPRKQYERKKINKTLNRTFLEQDCKYEEAQLIQEDYQKFLNQLYPEIRDPQLVQLQNTLKPKLDDYFRRISVCQNDNIEIGQSVYLNQESQLLFLEQKYACLDFFQKKEKEEIQLLYLQQQNKLSQKDLQIEKFEQIKQFNYFKPEWNIDNVIREMENKIIYPHNHHQRSKFKYYTFYPMIFYDQYKKKIRSSTKLELNDDKVQSPEDKKLRLRRLLRKTQILPV